MTELACVLNDLHVPHHDPEAVACALSLLKAVQPDRLYWNGDCLDAAPLSKYLKAPVDTLTLQEDLDAAKGVMQQFRAALPDTEFIFLTGNHEARLQKWLYAHPEVANLDCLRLDSLLDLPAIECALSPTGVEMWHEALITHGDIVRSKAGYTAQAMLDKWGAEIVLHGHTHRAGMVTRCNHSRRMTAIEGGCLCSLTPDYCLSPDWSHALVLLEWDSRRVWPHLINITDGECRWDGLTHPTLYAGD